MVTLSNNIITITRGDTFSPPLFINAGSDLKPVRYELGDYDEVYLGIMEPNQPFENAIVKKRYTKANINEYGDVKVRFEHDDTKCLVPGKYFYEIKAKFIKEDGSVDINTIIQRTEFWIQE